MNRVSFQKMNKMNFVSINSDTGTIEFFRFRATHAYNKNKLYDQERSEHGSKNNMLMGIYADKRHFGYDETHAKILCSKFMTTVTFFLFHSSNIFFLFYKQFHLKK